MTTDEIRGWVLGRLPDDWFVGSPEVHADDDEVLVLGTLDDSDVQGFRDRTREERMVIAREGERLFGRRMAWGVMVGGDRVLFTSLSVPVMTRLRLPERQVLDTLVQAGVARSRSEALAWCVKLVGRHEAEWIRELREALVKVNELRQRGPR